MIELDKVAKHFGNKRVLAGVSLKAAEGECFALAGKNGAGKTTMLKIMAGLLRADGGVVRIDGTVYDDYPTAVKRRMGLLLGEETLIGELTGYEYLQFVALAYGEKTNRKAIEQLYGYFSDQTDALSQRISKYSTGMKQKVALCAAVIHRPDILILDEPFAGIDPFSAGRYIDFINTYKKGRTIILSSHDLNYLSRVTDRIGVLFEGSMVFEDSVAAFTGSGEKDFETALFGMIPADRVREDLVRELFEKNRT